MRLNKDGTPDKRFKKNKKEELKIMVTPDKKDHFEKAKIEVDPNELLNQLLKRNNLKLDFDVVDGTIETKQGIIKLEKPTLVIKAFYVRN